MIPLKTAAQSNFESSTIAELKAYAGELGIDLPKNASSDLVRRKLLSQLGVNDEPAAEARPVVRTRAGGSDIFPPYNLSPNGIWGGRRRRVRLPRPEGAKMAAAEPFAWNGKHIFYIPFDETVAVPWPIFEILRTNKRRRPIAIKNALPDGAVEITTGWEFDDLSFSDYGDDPDTKDRACSMLEWYQSRGTEWFEQRTLRQLQLIAAKVDLSSADPFNKGRPMSQEDLLGRLKEFFFGFADAEADGVDKAA